MSVHHTAMHTLRIEHLLRYTRSNIILYNCKGKKFRKSFDVYVTNRMATDQDFLPTCLATSVPVSMALMMAPLNPAFSSS